MIGGEGAHFEDGRQTVCEGGSKKTVDAAEMSPLVVMFKGKLIQKNSLDDGQPRRREQIVGKKQHVIRGDARPGDKPAPVWAVGFRRMAAVSGDQSVETLGGSGAGQIFKCAAGSRIAMQQGVG